MLFNSIEFAIFLPLVFGAYWFLCLRNQKIQNALIILASYIFYGWWDWTFLSLIIFSSLVDYFIGIQYTKTKNKKKLLLLISITVNLVLLGFFKYFNFFIESFVEAFTFFGHTIKLDRLNIILPIGISFYTFQTLSYSIDAYKGKIQPTRNLLAFLAYVSFFPQLVAGPIERATNLLPQFYSKRKFEYQKAIDGMRQILWGLLKKLLLPIIAQCMPMTYSLITLNTIAVLFALGTIFFAFQIYGDFSGYSDIAIGTARLFGF